MFCFSLSYNRNSTEYSIFALVYTTQGSCRGFPPDKTHWAEPGYAEQEMKML
jgi:hypothetical protein